jgi:hypothetical protein
MFDKYNSQGSVSFWGEREATAGTSVELQVFADGAVSLLNFSLAIVRLDLPEYPVFATRPLQVLGAYYRRSILPFRFRTLGGDFHPAISLHTGPVPAGHYCADVRFVAESLADIYRLLYRLMLDGEPIIISETVKSSVVDADGTVTRRCFFLLEAGSHSLQLEVAQDSGVSAELSDGSLEFYRVI